MIAADLATVVDDWRRWLEHERRYSRHTLSAYQLDFSYFARFMAAQLGHRPADRLLMRYS